MGPVDEIVLLYQSWLPDWRVVYRRYRKVTHVLEYLGVTGHEVQLASKVQKKTSDNGCISIRRVAERTNTEKCQ